MGVKATNFVSRYSVFFLISLVVFTNIGIAQGAPVIDLNMTEPVDFEKEYFDLKINYEDSIKKYVKESVTNADILSSNQITYYYYEGRGYPYPLELIKSKLSHNPSYGENDTYLGQVVDSYFNDDNVNTTFQVIYNSTTQNIGLNLSGSALTFQDFTLYTEVEEAGEIDIVNATYADLLIRRDYTSYAYYDMGAGALEDFKLYCLFRLDYHNTDAWGGFTFMTNNIASEVDHRTNNYPFICWVVSGSFGKTQALEHDSSGVFHSSGSAVIVPDDTYYWVKFEKTGTLLEYDAYTTEALRNAEGNGDLYDGQITLQADYSFRYLMLCQSHDDNLAKIENLELYDVAFAGAGYADTGNYTTIEMINPDRGLAVLYNCTVPSGTELRLQFSNDSMTWVNHNGAVGYETLESGFGAVDIRDLNYTSLYLNATLIADSTNSYTPTMDQIRIVTIIGATSDNTGALLVLGLVVGMVIFIQVGKSL